MNEEMEPGKETIFKSNYDKCETFILRRDLLRPLFGCWDVCDPVSHAILDVVEAQRELADLFMDDADYGLATEADFMEVIKKRHAAGEKLMATLKDRGSWPDPELGQRE
jgi:hypothetical protein